MDPIPSSVYRFQLSKTFKISDATKQIPYLHDLGIEGVYCSPIFQAHDYGYDVTNPNLFNPDLGTLQEFEQFCTQLESHNMKQILDIVPNHMGIKGNKNEWWIDVLRNGKQSRFADFFDIDWQALNGKILLPILGDTLENTLTNHQISQPSPDWIQYYDYILPVNAGFETDLQKILEKQHYVLCHWRLSDEKLNYRRFLTINDLIGIRIEHEHVYHSHHKWALELLHANKVQGLRIDHPDGLWDPSQYIGRIAKEAPALIWLEKILEEGEMLPETWKVSGTVGYEFLNVLSGLFVQRKNQKPFTDIYHQFIQAKPKFKEIKYEQKKKFLLSHMQAEIKHLVSLIKNHPFDKDDLAKALTEFFAAFPVYRTYFKHGTSKRAKDTQYVQIAHKEAKKRAPHLSHHLFDYLRNVLLIEDEPQFVARFQQFTPMVTVKGVEDSSFYIYNRLISLNEVGGNPDRFGVSKSAFHAFNKQQFKCHPFGALTTSTHDTKFSEDARFRIHALSEDPANWKKHLTYWKELNAKHAIDLNTEYYLYQILIALGTENLDRLIPCLTKAIREAGTHTSWTEINQPYEAATIDFLNKIINCPNFRASFDPFQKQIAKYGELNSLSALILKIGSCGIPDIYQGTQHINPALMDPDNRRPIDLPLPTDTKTHLTTLSLHYRRDNKELFLKGSYHPIKTSENVIGFARKYKGKQVIILAKRFPAQNDPIEIKLPKGSFTSLFTNNLVEDLSGIFEQYPCAILIQ